MSQKDTIVAKCRDFLAHRQEVRLAYLFGSWLKAERPKDLDLALYLDDGTAEPIGYSLKIARELEEFLRALKIEPDVKVLNSAPLYFQYEVVRGREVVFVRDEAERVRFEAEVAIEYLDFLPLLEEYNRLMMEKIRSW